MTRPADAKVFEDAFNLMCGKLIASGASRHVYECTFAPSKHVVKVENEEPRRVYQNVIEAMIWDVAQDCKQTRWFAPVEWISPEGRVTLQRRTKPARRSDYPSRMPVFLTDFKYSNYGMLDGRLVCHDYGLAWIIGPGIQSKRTQAVKWRDE